MKIRAIFFELILIAIGLRNEPTLAGSFSSSYYCQPELECDIQSQGNENRDIRYGIDLVRSKDYAEALVHLDRFISEHKQKAKEMQQSLNEYPWESSEKIKSYGDLNDVALALLMKGYALEQLNRIDEARETYQELISEYLYGQCWCPSGSFEKPANAAVRLLEDLGLAQKDRPITKAEVDRDEENDQFKQHMESLKSTGQTLENLPQDQRAFALQYIAAVNSKNEHEFKKLMHPSVRRCSTALPQNSLGGSIPDNARISISPIPIAVSELNRQSETNSEWGISFPVNPTHQLQVIISSSDESIITTDSPKAVIKSTRSSVQTTTINLIKEKNHYFLVFACPSKSGTKEFREAKITPDINNGAVQEFWGKPTMNIEPLGSAPPQKLRTPAQPQKPTTPSPLLPLQAIQYCFEEKQPGWIDSFLEQFNYYNYGFWDDTVHYKAMKDKSCSTSKPQDFINGFEQRRFSNGQIQYTIPWRNGKRNGLMNAYTRAGNLLFEQPFRDGQPHGTGKWFDSRRSIMHEVSFRLGVPERIKTYEQGILLEDIFIKKQKLTTYEKDGRKKMETVLKDTQVESYKERFEL